MPKKDKDAEAPAEPAAAPAAGGWPSFNIFAPLGLALENGFEQGLDACAPCEPFLSAAVP
jgi:hypothetical protein